MGQNLELATWIIAQTLVLSIIIIGAFVRGRERQTRNETSLELITAHMDEKVGELRTDHANLAKKVDNISRTVARIEGGCLAIKRPSTE